MQWWQWLFMAVLALVLVVSVVNIVRILMSARRTPRHAAGGEVEQRVHDTSAGVDGDDADDHHPFSRPAEPAEPADADADVDASLRDETLEAEHAVEGDTVIDGSGAKPRNAAD